MKTSKDMFAYTNRLFVRKSGYIMFLILFVSGVIAGTITSVLNDNQVQTKIYLNNLFSAYSLQGIANRHIYFVSFANYCKIIAFIWISGWHILLYPFGIAMIFIKGFKIGFTISSVLYCLGYKGILFILFTIILPNVLFITLLCLFWIYQTHFILNKRRMGYLNTSANKKLYIQNLVVLLFVFAVANICSVIDGFIVPSILNHIISLMFT